MHAFTFSDCPAIYRDRSDDTLVTVTCLSADHERHAARTARLAYRTFRHQGTGRIAARQAVAGRFLLSGYPVDVTRVSR